MRKKFNALTALVFLRKLSALIHISVGFRILFVNKFVALSRR